MDNSRKEKFYKFFVDRGRWFILCGIMIAGIIINIANILKQLQ